MFDAIKNTVKSATSRATQIAHRIPTGTRYTMIALATAALSAGEAMASTSGSTATVTSSLIPAVGQSALPATTFTIYDVIATIVSEVYPAIIPILTAGAVVFAAWWVWHRARGAVS